MGLGDREADLLGSLADVLRPRLPSVVAAFSQRVLADAEARDVLGGESSRAEELPRLLGRWLGELFCGRYDEDYYHRRQAIGRAHVQVNLPQHLMITFMEVVRQELTRIVREAGVPDEAAKLEAVHRLLAVEAVVMLESYKEDYTSLIRQQERTLAEKKLTRAEHLAEIGQLAASLAHEIKNPLAGISGAIEVIRDSMRPDDPHREIVREILGQIGRLDGSVKDLLVYARPNPPDLSPCDLGSVVRRVLRLMRDTPAFSRVELAFDLHDKVPPIPADERQIEQLVINLLVNAVHACKRGGEVRTSLSAADGLVRLVVHDTGQGMASDVSARAFEPFYTTKAKGTGLGLPICRKIIEAHKGSIALHSEMNRGTRVVVELPQASSPRPAGKSVT